MDADVISIETARSNMEILEAFERFRYPAEVGPGVWDIHSPRVPSADEMEKLLTRAIRVLPVENLWVNPDCGLKTRGWPETTQSLSNMVQAASRLRRRFAAPGQTEAAPPVNSVSACRGADHPSTSASNPHTTP